jgi:hypothetical protein
MTTFTNTAVRTSNSTKTTNIKKDKTETVNNAQEVKEVTHS